LTDNSSLLKQKAEWNNVAKQKTLVKGFYKNIWFLIKREGGVRTRDERRLVLGLLGQKAQTDPEHLRAGHGPTSFPLA